MNFYVIRDVDTGLCLPFIKKGNTRAELSDPKVHPPRLFTTKRGATLAMVAWKKGYHVATWDFADCDYSSGGAYVDGITIHPKKDRLRVNLEVTRAYLHLEF